MVNDSKVMISYTDPDTGERSKHESDSYIAYIKEGDDGLAVMSNLTSQEVAISLHSLISAAMELIDIDGNYAMVLSLVLLNRLSAIGILKGEGFCEDIGKHKEHAH